MFETDVDVTTIQTAATVFEAYGAYNGTTASAKAGSALPLLKFPWSRPNSFANCA